MAWDGGWRSALDVLPRIGYQGVELQVRDPAVLDTHELLGEMRRSGLAVAGLSCGPVASDDELFLTAPDREVREAAVARPLSIVELAGQWGTHLAIGSARGRIGWAAAPAQGSDWLIGGLARLTERASELGVSLLIEPQTRYVTDCANTVAEADELIALLGSQSLALEVDTYHAALEEDSVVATIVRAGSAGRLAHVQLSDSNRKAPGHGSLGWADILTTLAAVGYAGWLSIEVTQNPNSAAVATSAYRFLTAMASPL